MLNGKGQRMSSASCSLNPVLLRTTTVFSNSIQLDQSGNIVALDTVVAGQVGLRSGLLRPVTRKVNQDGLALFNRCSY